MGDSSLEITDNGEADGGNPIIFRTFDDGYVVRSMTSSDAKIVQQWYTTMGHISQYDLDIALGVYPPGPGFYIGELDGQVIASAIRIPWTEDIFYGSLYFVHEDFRRNGYGTRLRDQVAREHVGNGILCVDSVMGKVAQTNKKHGYVERFKTARFQAVAKKHYDILFSGGTIVKASDVSFDDVINYDNKCFITKDNPRRARFLRQWINIPDGAAYAAVDAGGGVVGLGCRRPCIGEKLHMIGPLYADSKHIAEALLQELCKDVAGEEYCFSTWVPNEDAMSMASDFGMEHVFDALRMHVNGDAKELKKEVFVFTSIDVCGF